MSLNVHIGAEGINVAALMDEIRQTVARKMADGVYQDVRVAAAERTNLSQIADQDQFFALYLASLREMAAIDINDFPITERRRFLAPLLIRLKTLIWNLLKFYTYRLWSQQNQVNALFLALLEELDGKYRRRIEALEARIRELESRQREQGS